MRKWAAKRFPARPPEILFSEQRVALTNRYQPPLRVPPAAPAVRLGSWASGPWARRPVVQVRFGALHRRQLVLNLAQPSQIGLAFLLGEGPLGGPKFAM